MLKRIVCAAACALLMTAPLWAQAKPAAPQKPATLATPTDQATKEAVQKALETVERARGEGGQPVNIKIELAITDQVGVGQAAKKVVTMIVGDRQRNSIRSSANILVHLQGGGTTYRTVTINVDARPAIFPGQPNKMMLDFGLEYQPKSAGTTEDLEPGMGQLNERLSLVLESGKPVVVSQAADPTSDRKITVEVTATILK